MTVQSCLLVSGSHQNPPDPDLLFASHDICEQNFHVIHCLLKIKSMYSFSIAEMRKQREFYHKLGMEVPGDIKGETCSAKQHLDPHRNGEWVPVCLQPRRGFGMNLLGCPVPAPQFVVQPGSFWGPAEKRETEGPPRVPGGGVLCRWAS